MKTFSKEWKSPFNDGGGGVVLIATNPNAIWNFFQPYIKDTKAIKEEAIRGFAEQFEKKGWGDMTVEIETYLSKLESEGK